VTDTTKLATTLQLNLTDTSTTSIVTESSVPDYTPQIFTEYSTENISNQTSVTTVPIVIASTTSVESIQTELCKSLYN
jgi:hypothetical protein